MEILMSRSASLRKMLCFVVAVPIGIGSSATANSKTCYRYRDVVTDTVYCQFHDENAPRTSAAIAKPVGPPVAIRLDVSGNPKTQLERFVYFIGWIESTVHNDIRRQSERS